MIFKIENGVLLRYDGTETHVTIPEGVTEIEGYSFYERQNLEEVTIPEGVTKIKPGAFFHCVNLKRVFLPEGLTLIGKQAFMHCFDLESINIPDSVEEIEDDAFCRCKELKLTHIPDHPIMVDPDAFLFCEPSITERFDAIEKEALGISRVLNDPSAMKCAVIATIDSIRSHPNADNLVCATVLGHNVIVGKDAYIGQRVVYFPAGVELDYMFAFDNGLLRERDENGKVISGYLDPIKVVVPTLHLRGEISEGLALPIEVLTPYTDVDALQVGQWFSSLNGEDICMIYNPHGMFTDRRSRTLTHCNARLIEGSVLRIPWGVERIGKESIKNVEKIEEIIFPESVKVIEEKAFTKCQGLKRITIPGSVKIIGRSAFEGTDIEEVILSEGVRRIDAWAFSRCKKLRKIVIPGSVDYIKKRAFWCCEKLCDLTIGEGVKRIGAEAFWGCNSLTSIALPKSIRSVGENAFLGCGKS